MRVWQSRCIGVIFQKGRSSPAHRPQVLLPLAVRQTSKSTNNLLRLIQKSPCNKINKSPESRAPRHIQCLSLGVHPASSYDQEGRPKRCISHMCKSRKTAAPFPPESQENGTKKAAQVVLKARSKTRIALWSSIPNPGPVRISSFFFAVPLGLLLLEWVLMSLLASVLSAGALFMSEPMLGIVLACEVLPMATPVDVVLLLQLL